MTRRGWLLFLALGLIWGLPYLLIRVSVREVSPGFLVFARTGGGAVLLMPWAVKQGGWAALMRHWRPLVAYTIVEIGVPWWLLFTAEKRVTSSLAGLLVAAVPIAGAVIARLKGTDHLDRRRLGGLALGMAGVALLVGFDVGASSLWAASSFLVIVTGYALGPWLLSRYLSELPGATVITASLVLCAVLYVPVAIAQRPERPLSNHVVLSIAALAVVCTAIAFMAFFALIAEVGPMRATVVTYLNPAVAVVLGVSVLGENFGPATAIGFMAVLSGSFLSTRPLRGVPASSLALGASPAGAAPALGTVTPALGVVTPALGTVTPVLGTVTPALGAVTPALGAVTPALGAATPALGAATPAPEAVTPALRDLDDGPGPAHRPTV